MKRTSLDVWHAESFRFTFFPSPPIAVQPVTWWSDVVGEEPETNITRSRDASIVQFGPFSGGVLSVQINPLRIDWVLGPKVDAEKELSDHPVVGIFPATLDKFVQVAKKWLVLASVPPLGRLAFGATLLLPVESREAGYSQIQAYLPSVKLDIDGSSDFNYQINRPRADHSGKYKINRLSKWSVAKFTSFGVHFIPGMPIASERGDGTYACRLEMDINTQPEPNLVLLAAQITDVVDELVSLAKEIVSEGDIK